MTTTYFDLQGALNAQKDLVLDLCGSITNSSVLSNLKTAYTNLTGDLNNDVSQFILTKYGNIKDIINTEKERIDTKEKSVNSAIESKKRLIFLNNNYISRTQVYIQLFVFFVLMLLFIIFLKLMGVSETVYSIAIIVGVSSFVIFLINQITLLKSRDNLDYNSINEPPPKILTPDQKNTELVNAKNKISQGGDIINSLNLGICLGSNCCAAGTHWDVSAQVCVNGTESFTPSEFTEYSLY